MKKQNRFLVSAVLFATFALWTILLRFVNVQAIGPLDSNVGLAAINGFFHHLTGVHMTLYTLTDLVSIVPLGLVGCFGALGLWQWIRGKSILKVDADLLALGVFYLLVLGVFVFFECVVINSRPVLIDGCLEASYPSSTTMLALCVLSTAAMQLKRRLTDNALRRFAVAACLLLMALMLVGRLLSGVHWLTDIIGGMLVSGGLVALYAALIQ